MLELNYYYAPVEGPQDSEETVVTPGAIFNITGSVRLDAGFQQTLGGRNAARAGSFVVNLSKTF